MNGLRRMEYTSTMLSVMKQITTWEEHPVGEIFFRLIRTFQHLFLSLQSQVCPFSVISDLFLPAHSAQVAKLIDVVSDPFCENQPYCPEKSIAIRKKICNDFI